MHIFDFVHSLLSRPLPLSLNFETAQLSDAHAPSPLSLTSTITLTRRLSNQVISNFSKFEILRVIPSTSTPTFTQQSPRLVHLEKTKVKISSSHAYYSLTHRSSTQPNTNRNECKRQFKHQFEQRPTFRYDPHPIFVNRSYKFIPRTTGEQTLQGFGTEA